jgi:hypothetical protein
LRLAGKRRRWLPMLNDTRVSNFLLRIALAFGAGLMIAALL